MNENKITEHFSSQLNNVDIETISKINEARNKALNGTTKQKGIFPKYILASVLPCFLVAGLFMSQNNVSEYDDVMVDLLLDETLMESYVYETTEEEFSEMLALNTVYDFE